MESLWALLNIENTHSVLFLKSSRLVNAQKLVYDSRLVCHLVMYLQAGKTLVPAVCSHRVDDGTIIFFHAIQYMIQMYYLNVL